MELEKMLKKAKREQAKKDRIETIQMLREIGADNNRIFKMFQKRYNGELSNQDIRNLMEAARPKLIKLTWDDLTDADKQFVKECKEEYADNGVEISTEEILDIMSEARRERLELKMSGSNIFNMGLKARMDDAEREGREEGIKRFTKVMRESGTADDTAIFKMLKNIYGKHFSNEEIRELMNQTK